MQTLSEVALYAIFIGPAVALAIAVVSTISYVLLGFENKEH